MISINAKSGWIKVIKTYFWPVNNLKNEVIPEINIVFKNWNSLYLRLMKSELIMIKENIEETLNHKLMKNEI